MTAGVVEFDCEGCGVHVLGYGRDTVPKSHLCAVCEWFCEAYAGDPEAMIRDMRRIGHLTECDR